MAEKIEIEGLKELTRALRKIDPELTKELKQANKDAAADVASVAQGLVPRRTGKLASSIRAGATIKSGVVRAGRAKLPYARIVHFGNPKTRQRPQPFLYEALDHRRNEVGDAWAAAVERIIDKAQGGTI
ncbi:MAG: hypothetical protein QOE09_374 [Ilumatobacteraceae bacterium]|jgi:HK97 gp10 family phage protein